VKYEFIRAEKALYPVTLLCRCLKVTRSGFYAWLRRGSKRELDDRRLLTLIREIFLENRRAYGSRRIYRELRVRGVRCSRTRVERLMREAEITPPRRRRFRKTTDSDHALPVAENLLDREFSSSAPNQRWVTDITYIWTLEGWLYLAVVLDLFSRRIVGWAMDKTLKAENLTLRSLHMALFGRQPAAGLLHHSDRGSQYACKDYQDLLDLRGITCSMSRRGNCWDNAVAESFFATLKLELVYLCVFRTRAEARMEIFDYIEAFYNRKRRHSYLGYLSPADFEKATEHAA
jgi:transposase InsO family protein